MKKLAALVLVSFVGCSAGGTQHDQGKRDPLVNERLTAYCGYVHSGLLLAAATLSNSDIHAQMKADTTKKVMETILDGNGVGIKLCTDASDADVEKLLNDANTCYVNLAGADSPDFGCIAKQLKTLAALSERGR